MVWTSFRWPCTFIMDIEVCIAKVFGHRTGGWDHIWDKPGSARLISGAIPYPILRSITSSISDESSL